MISQFIYGVMFSMMKRIYRNSDTRSWIVVYSENLSEYEKCCMQYFKAGGLPNIMNDISLNRITVHVEWNNVNYLCNDQRIFFHWYIQNVA